MWDNGYEKKKEVSSVVSMNCCRYKTNRFSWDNAQMLTDDEIKQFLSDGE